MKVICFGDSNTWGYDPRGYWGGRYDQPWPEILGRKTGWQVVNEGMNGREIPGKVQSFPEDTDLLLVMLGTNDLLQGLSPEAVCQRMAFFLKSLDREKLLLISPPHMQLGHWVEDRKLIAASRELGERYEILAASLGIRFANAGNWNLPLAYDGVHLTEEAHRIFASEILTLLKGETI